MSTTHDTAFPAPRHDPLLPSPAYAAHRAETPVARVRLASGQSVWLVTGYHDVRAVLADARFSSEILRPGFPQIQAAAPTSVPPAAFMVLDPPAHTRYRAPLIGEFTTRRIAALEPRIRSIVESQAEVLAKQPRPADLVELFALPVPSLVICELLGVPYEKAEFFQSRSQVVLSRVASTEEVDRANQDLFDLIAAVVETKRAHPGDDVLSRLIAHESAFTLDEIVTVAVVLLTAGHETTANMISLGVLRLLHEPEIWQSLAQGTRDPGPVVEELLRLLTVVQSGVPRVAIEDVMLSGTLIRAGEGVIALLAGANHDPAVFGAPERIHPERVGPRHLAFGYGLHLCLGHTLARAELRVVFETLPRLFPNMRLPRDGAPPLFADGAFVYGVEGLNVEW
ncbi:cytochrome P450 [Streptomyces sp. NPDC060223]|uniref:cytochrome P450 n=1 Tax=unclassified Streptomyces TaxID=2593676 RepID=UPI003625D874